jgi:hypothetical protein
MDFDDGLDGVVLATGPCALVRSSHTREGSNVGIVT